MQNKYCNIIFYLLIIVVMTLCSLGTINRYKADFYFDIARHYIPSYSDRGENLALMQSAYWKAVEANPLEFTHYANKLNGDYLKRISRRK